MKPSSCFPVEDFAPPMHLAPTFYPPVYQHQADASGFHHGHWGPTGIFSPENWFIASGAQKSKVE